MSQNRALACRSAHVFRHHDRESYLVILQLVRRAGHISDTKQQRPAENRETIIIIVGVRITGKRSNVHGIQEEVAWDIRCQNEAFCNDKSHGVIGVDHIICTAVYAKIGQKLWRLTIDHSGGVMCMPERTLLTILLSERGWNTTTSFQGKHAHENQEGHDREWNQWGKNTFFLRGGVLKIVTVLDSDRWPRLTKGG
jgi:hypothetical protein